MTDTLIDELVAELRPVRRLSSPARRFAEFSLVASVVTTGGVWFLGPRADWRSSLVAAPFLAETALLVVLFGSATLAALKSGVPGENAPRANALVPLATASWFALAATRGPFSPEAGAVAHGLACLERTLLLGALPALALAWMLRRSAPLERRGSSLLAFVAAGALAVLGTRFVCAREDSLHVVVWHVVPVLAAALLGWLSGREVLALPRRRPPRRHEVTS